MSKIETPLDLETGFSGDAEESNAYENNNDEVTM